METFKEDVTFDLDFEGCAGVYHRRDLHSNDEGCVRV